MARTGLFRRTRWAACVAAATVLAWGAPSDAVPTRTYVNPVSKAFADTFADPAVIRAKDGFWYAVGTSDPLREGEGEYHLLPMARSRDLVNWTYVGDAFNETNAPEWMAVPEMWAPDIRFFDGRYYLYYVVTDTTTSEAEFDNAIGVATAPSPTGPWTDSGAPVVGPRRGESGEPDDYLWTFDPSLFTDEDGTRYLYYGSYYGGIYVTRLSRDGLRAVGEPTMVAIDNRYEGAYVVRRGGFYYLFASSGDCCAGPTTGYTVFAGRARRPTGPFVDRDGIPMTASRVGGTTVVSPNGNRWVGTGHNAVVTDLSGQDWLAYHAIDKRDPFLDEPFGVNERPMLLDRLDWIDGWPTVRAGRWASENRERAPVTDFAVAIPDGSTTSSCEPSYLMGNRRIPRDYRAEADLRLRESEEGRGRIGLVVGGRNPPRVAALLDERDRSLALSIAGNGAVTESVALPAGFRFSRWHNVAIEKRGDSIYAEVTDARLNDPLASVRVDSAPDVSGATVGVFSRCARADVANGGATRLYRARTRPAPPPRVGRVVARFSDGFDDGALDPQWSWVREPAGTETGGVYRWPTQDADLWQDTNDASVLLRRAPRGPYTVETKLRLELGVNDVRNFQQAGLVAYIHDDLVLRLTHVAVWNTRQTEFLKEMPYADGISDGAMAIGTPADVTWLRLSHRIDRRASEHEFRAATSRDGESWTWGGTWTLPLHHDPRIGLISMGGRGAVAEFDFFRVRRP